MPEPTGEDGPLILVFGDVMLDRNLWARIERISPEAPAPVAHVERETQTLGGAGNVAHNVRCLEGRPLLVGVRGDDADGAALERLAAGLGIGCRLVVDPSRPTTTKERILTGRGQQVLRLDRECRAPLPPAVEKHLLAQLRAAQASAGVVVVSDYAKGVVTDRLLRRLLRQAGAAGQLTVIDPKRRDFRAYRGASVLTPNLSEAAAALGRERLPEEDAGAAEAGRKLRRLAGVGHVLLTRGGRGMALCGPEGEVCLPARAREVSDVTGAGDTVVAALAVALAEGLPLVDAAEWANRAAGLAVAKVGTQPVYRAELEEGLHLGRTGHKVLTWEGARHWAEGCRRSGLRVVFTNGCFDILHAGHLRCLEEARRHGDRLLVALNSDASVRGLKGPGRPVVPQEQRAALLAGLACVDAVVVFDEPDPAALVEVVRPDVLVKGGDYRPEQIAGAARVLADGGQVVIVPLVEGVSTTGLLGRARAGDPPKP